MLDTCSVQNGGSVAGNNIAPVKELKNLIVSDEQLVLRCISGNTAAFDCLYKRHSRSILLLCKRIVRDYHHAQDIAQEAFKKAFLNLKRLKRPEKFRGWLLMIARRSALDFVAAKIKLTNRTLEELSISEIPRIPSTQEYLTELKDEADHLYTSLSGLPDDLNIFSLYYRESLCCVEIAKQLNKSPNCVRTRLSRLRKLLRLRMRRSPAISCTKVSTQSPSEEFALATSFQGCKPDERLIVASESAINQESKIIKIEITFQNGKILRLHPRVPVGRIRKLVSAIR